MQKHLLFATLLGGAGIVAIATPALAQTADRSAPPSTSQASSTPDAPADIIVTAQRREERAQNVPIAMTAFSAETLQRQNISKPQDLYGKVPSLVVGNQGQSTRDVQSYSIRGQSTGLLASPAVPVYLAEVPVPAQTNNQQGSPGMFIDLENVQVLAGPQGTLFGRNTTGGAVLVVPHKPTDRFEGYLEGSIGNYDLRGLEGAINVPIVSDVLMIRAAGAYQDRRGFTRDIVWNKWRDDIHYWTGRLGITFKPSDRFENYLLGYYTKSANNGAGHILEGFNLNLLKGIGFCADAPATPVPGLGVSCNVYRRQVELSQEIGPRATRLSTDEYSRIRNWGIINNTRFNLTDELMLRNIISYQRLTSDYSSDQDGSPLQQYDYGLQNARFPTFPINGLTEFGLPLTGPTYTNAASTPGLPSSAVRQFTEELQLQGDLLDKNLTFTAGGFYYNATPGPQESRTLSFCPALFTGLCSLGGSSTGVSNKSRALYAQGTLDFGYFDPSLDTLRLTLGYRYTWDTVSGFAVGVRPTADNTFEATLRSKAPTWTIGVDYRPIPDLMLYAKVSHGYKAGGINTIAVHPETRIFQPEKLTSYEAGFKSNWVLGTMPFRLNANYYYSDYSNIQRPAGDFNAATGAQGAQILGATARIQGFELDGSLRPVKGIEIGGNLSYTDAKYKKFTQVILAPQGQIACNSPVVGGNVIPIPAGGTADYSCNRFQFVAPWIFSVHANIDIPTPESLGDLSLFVNYSHVSSQNTSPLTPQSIGGISVEPGVLIEGYGLLNASATLRNVAGTGFDLSVFGTNLTNKLYRVSNSGVYQTLATWTNLYGEPRMFGMRLRYRFGN